MTNHLLTTIEAAEYLTMSKPTLERWRLTGEGPKFVKMGDAVRYRPADLDAFIAENVVQSTAEGARK
jgi:excisionase family DNA binding protein